MPIRVRSIALHVLNTRARMPFRYGIATLSAVPHLFVRIEVDAPFGPAFDFDPTRFTRLEDWEYCSLESQS